MENKVISLKIYYGGKHTRTGIFTLALLKRMHQQALWRDAQEQQERRNKNTFSQIGLETPTAQGI